jgi:hypothetical protein
VGRRRRLSWDEYASASLSGLGNQLLTLVNNPFYGIIPSGRWRSLRFNMASCCSVPGLADCRSGRHGYQNSEYDAAGLVYQALFKGPEHHRQLYLVELAGLCRSWCRPPATG